MYIMRQQQQQKQQNVMCMYNCVMHVYINKLCMYIQIYQYTAVAPEAAEYFVYVQICMYIQKCNVCMYKY